MDVESYEERVYKNQFNYNGLPADEYKYFDLLAFYHRKLEIGEITQEEFEAKRTELLTEYHNVVNDIDFTPSMKKAIINQREVMYKGGKYKLHRIMLGRHFKEPRLYLQAELLDKNGSTLVTVSWEELVKENKHENQKN